MQADSLLTELSEEPHINYTSIKLNIKELIIIKIIITAYSDSSHEIRRRLLLGRKAMALSVLKSRDVTLPAKVRVVKAAVFPVMYGCESWTIKKAECQKIDALELWCWRRS